MKRQVFFSFHYKNDASRVQLIRNIGAIQNDQIVTPNKWETIKQKGDSAVKKWIDTNLERKSCLIVLIGQETANSRWVNYEIKQALRNSKPIFGIYIHNLKNLQGDKAHKGQNPFDNILLGNGKRLSKSITCYNPPQTDTYQYIAENLENWIEEAIISK